MQQSLESIRQSLSNSHSNSDSISQHFPLSLQQHVTSCIGYRFSNVSSINCTLVFNCLYGVAPVYLSTMCQPVSERISAVAVYVRLHVEICLFQLQGRCITVSAALLWLDCLHGIPWQRHWATSFCRHLKTTATQPPTSHAVHTYIKQCHYCTLSVTHSVMSTVI